MCVVMSSLYSEKSSNRQLLLGIAWSYQWFDFGLEEERLTLSFGGREAYISLQLCKLLPRNFSITCEMFRFGCSYVHSIGVYL
jgi:hypothetical protein